MKLLVAVFLFCCALSVCIPAQCIAAFYTPVKTAIHNNNTTEYFGDRRNKYSHMQHFRGGHTHTFCGVVGLGCTMIGSVAVVATLAAAIVGAPVAAFVVATYGFNILGIIFGLISFSDTDGSTAVFLGLANLLVFWLGGAIYQATLGNFVPLLKFATVFR